MNWVWGNASRGVILCREQQWAARVSWRPLGFQDAVSDSPRCRRLPRIARDITTAAHWHARQSPGSFENAHALRDGRAMPKPLELDEQYDLVVVGAEYSGLAAAHFYRQAAPNARILLLDNHDDFGGHAERNEFEEDGKLLLIRWRYAVD